MSRAHRLVCVQCASQVYKNIDMCFQGDVEIIQDWKRHKSIDQPKKIVEEKGYSAVCVGSFGHAALKSFDYQLTKEHCKPSREALFHYGNTSSASVWYELAWSEACSKNGVLPGEKVWQIAFGSGFKCNSAVWKALRHNKTQHTAWLDP